MRKLYLITLALITGGVLAAQEDTTAIKELEEVVVATGQFKPQTLKNSVYKIRVIDRERITLRGATDIISVLNTELGIRLSTDYTLGETDIQLMGMSGQNVKILLDGIPLVDRGSTRQSLSQVDINTIERIEIVEGPMSVVYGTDALAGVVNLITKKNYSKGKSLVQVTARVHEETVAGDYKPFNGDGVHNESAGVFWQHQKGWSLGSNFSRNHFGGWQGKETGRVEEWKPKTQYLASGNIGYTNNKLQASYKLDYLYEDIFTKGKVEADDRAADAKYFTYRTTHSALADWRINNKWSVNASASYQDYERRAQNTIMDFTTGTEYLNPNLPQDVSVFRMLFFRSTAQYLLSDKVSLQPGFEFKSDRSSGQRIHGEPVINDYAVFISSELKPTDKWNIRPGLRFSKNSVYDAPPVIPSLNLKYDVDKNWTVRAAYARGFRAPALRELYFTFHDASHDIEGNPDLKAEHSNSFNVSVSRRGLGNAAVKIQSAVSGFYNVFENMIIYAGHPTIANWVTLANVDHFKTVGALLENTLTWKNLQATIGVSYVGRYNKFRGDEEVDAGKELKSFLWSPEVNSNVVYRLVKSGLAFSLFYKYTGKMPGFELRTVNGTEALFQTEIEGFHLADLSVTKALGKYLNLTGGVKNIFDVTRLQNTSTDTGGAHSTGGPVLKSYGRSYFLGLLLNWNNK